MQEAPHLPRGAVPDPVVPPGVDATKPSPARLYDYYLGGRNNFAVDRRAAEALRQSLPALSDAAWANRGFHQRAATWLARAGLRQFIDIGSGLPTVGNTHQIVQRVDPAARVVYADIDPMVEAQSAPLLAGSPNVVLVTADLRDPDALLGHPGVRSMIDFSEPTGLLMTAVMHFVADEADPWRLVGRYVGALFFAGLELVPPYPGADGLTFVGQWGAVDPASADSDGSRVLYCGVAKCP